MMTLILSVPAYALGLYVSTFCGKKSRLRCVVSYYCQLENVRVSLGFGVVGEPFCRQQIPQGVDSLFEGSQSLLYEF